VTAHAIRNDEEPSLLIGVRIKAVFIACPDAPDICAGGDG
jgi:hypothetical protein